MMMYVNYLIHLRHKVKNESLVEQKKFLETSPQPLSDGE